MKHFHSLEEVRLDCAAIIAIGNFDGVHRGHRDLIAQQVRAARADGACPVVLTFFPHPARVIAQTRGPFYLTTPDERAALLGALGVHAVVTLAFDDTLRRTRAADFVDRLTQHLRVRSLWVGADFAMGYRREGTAPFLAALGEAQGFTVRVIDMLLDEDSRKVSSSDIRASLRRGAVEQAARDLGRLYRVDGPVVGGQKRGHRIGFPTANLAVWREKMLPAAGVYAGWAWAGAQRCAAVTNIGVRPTFDGGGGQTVEVHLLDFEGDLYGREVAFEFVRRLRGEQKFDGIAALSAQIAQDVARARALLRRT